MKKFLLSNIKKSIKEINDTLPKFFVWENETIENDFVEQTWENSWENLFKGEKIY